MKENVYSDVKFSTICWNEPEMYEIFHECQITPSDRDDLKPGIAVFIPGSPGIEGTVHRTPSEVHFMVEQFKLKMTWQPGNQLDMIFKNAGKT